MNKEFTYSNNEVIIETGTGFKITEAVDNIKEILTTQNNIEEIENIKKDNDINSKRFHNLEFSNSVFLKSFKKFGIITTPIAILIYILITVITNIPVGLMSIPLIFSGIGIIGIALDKIIDPHEKISKKIVEKSNGVLSEELKKQNQKLNQLKKDSKVLTKTDSNMNYEIITIERTDLIEDLRRKLKLIEDYQLNKDKYIKYYKRYLLSTYLKNKNYSTSDILFIQMLVEEDLKEKKKKSNKNSKTLILEKK